MQNHIVAYDVSTVMLLLITTIYFIRTSPNRNIRFNIFFLLLLVDFLGAIWDIVRISTARTSLYGGSFWNLSNILYMAIITFVTPLYLMYIIGITDTMHIFRRTKSYIVLAVVPVILEIIVLIISLFRPVFIIVDNNGLLSYEWGYHFIIVLLFVYFAVCTLFVIRLTSFVGVDKVIVMMVPIVVIVIALTIQFFLDRHHVVCFAVAINCLMLVLINRRAEDSIDVVTGMHSYSLFAENIGMKINSGSNMELILINIVNFKRAQRIIGYDNMSELLAPISDEIRHILKKYNAANTCYYNGDGKFAIEVSSRHSSKVMAISGEIIRSINENMSLGLADLEIRINACIANCPADVSDLDSLFVLISDLDIYPITGVVLSASEITGTEEFQMKKEMSTILDRALSNNYFSVYYQPIYDVKEERFASAEALIRLRDPKFGFISPGMFIPLAEKSGAIHAIGSFVIEEVCRFISSEAFDRLKLEYIEINLSVMQCLRADLADEIIMAAKKYNIDPKKLNLEITETASSYSQEKMYANVDALSKEGFSFSLDDFGTGYSNLMRMAQLPIEIVKFDRAFVLLEESGGFTTIITNLINMLKDMGKKILVEGIENKEMLEAFISMGVDEIQGFYFSKPLNERDYIEFLEIKNVP